MSVYDVEVGVKLNKQGFDSDLKQVGSDTKQTGEALSSRAVAIGNVMSDLAKKGGQFFVEMAKTGIQYNAQIETYTTSLTTALGNEAAAAAAIEQIKQDAAKTPYSVDGLVQANSYLIAAGESAGKARDTIMALGDAVAATGGGNAELQRMAQNLQQVMNVGKATAMDIKQFQMAGIEVYGLIADYTGKTKEEVQSMTITYDLLSGALQHAAKEGGKFYGAMQRQSETLNGQVSTLRDNIQSKLGEAFQSVAETLSGTVLPKVNEFVESFDMEKAAEGAKNVATALGVIGATIAAQKVSAVVGGWVAAFQAAQVQIGLYSMEVGTAGVAQGALNGQLTIGEVIVAAMTGKISLATAAQALWNAATAAFPAALIVGALAAIGVGIAKFKSDMADARAAGESFGDSTEEVSARLAELKAQYEAYDTAIITGEGETVSAWRMDQLAAEIQGLESRLESLKAAEEEAAASGEILAEGAGIAAEGLDGLSNSTDETVQALQDIITNYDKLHEDISKKVEGWFGLFDTASVNIKTSVQDMMASMQSQIDFNTNYAANLKNLADYGLGALGTAFQQMGPKGAAYADAIVKAVEDAGGAASEGGQEVINGFLAMAEGVSDSQADLSDALTDITGSLEEQLEKWGESADDAAKSLDVSKQAALAATASVTAYINGIKGGNQGAYDAAYDVAKNAEKGFSDGGGGGTGGGGGGGIHQHAEGADYIPYDNYLAYLHKGEMVIPADISNDLRDFVGGSSGGRSPQPVREMSIGRDDGTLQVIVNLLEDIVQNGLNANIGRSQVYRAVSQENRVRTKATNYNVLGAMT